MGRPTPHSFLPIRRRWLSGNWRCTGAFFYKDGEKTYISQDLYPQSFCVSPDDDLFKMNFCRSIEDIIDDRGFFCINRRNIEFVITTSVGNREPSHRSGQIVILFPKRMLMKVDTGVFKHLGANKVYYSFVKS